MRRQQYKDKKLIRFAAGERVKEYFPFERQLKKRLLILLEAPTKRSLMLLPSNHFEALKGDRKGQYSIRVNEQWRLCFEWPDAIENPYNIEVVDYH